MIVRGARAISAHQVVEPVKGEGGELQALVVRGGCCSGIRQGLEVQKRGGREGGCMCMKHCCSGDAVPMVMVVRLLVHVGAAVTVVVVVI